jgi:hypothetical protein
VKRVPHSAAARTERQRRAVAWIVGVEVVYPDSVQTVKRFAHRRAQVIPQSKS